ncbi:growth/differentiation factor 10 isoform X2 [Carettochelys insculpta]|uniref:growth/differentiation factor 10 isoform X2 n=1 Tax=Carettochelys insculpta TaxID=44489 RepID=UPI003EB7EAC6
MTGQRRAGGAGRGVPAWRPGPAQPSPGRCSAAHLAGRRLAAAARCRRSPMAGRLACCLLLWALGQGGASRQPGPEPPAPARDAVAVHMLKLYEKYSREGGRAGDGNTVRSFKARRELLGQKPLYCFNLTSMQDSELILSATFHLYWDKPPRHREVICKRTKNSSCRLLHLPPIPRLSVIFRSVLQNSAYGLVKGNITVFLHRRGAWQTKDISHVVKESKRDGELILCAELSSGEKYQDFPEPLSDHLPYILVYANDLAISDPNSVAVTLQRYDPFPSSDGDPSLAPNASTDTRVRRDIFLSSSIQNNELPEVDYSNYRYNKHDIWESAYKSLKPKTSRRDRRKKGKESSEMLTKSQVLNFDEKTMKKARRKQWNEPRICSRRYMKVDFADIGWNEWIISPKSFDAYYCAGALLSFKHHVRPLGAGDVLRSRNRPHRL